MTSRIQGWSNRQKDTGWGYAFAHYIPGVALYYGITRRTLDNIWIINGGQIFVQIIVVFLLESRFRFPRLFDYEGLNENTLVVVIFFDLLLLPFFAKLAISEARKDGKKRLKKTKAEINGIEKEDELKEIKEEVEQLKNELKQLKREDK